MLDTALVFLRDELNSYITTRVASDSVQATLTAIVNEQGKYAIADDSLGLCLLSVDEERTMKAPLPARALVGGQQLVQQPELKLNLNVMVAANFKFYDQALKYLSWVLLFFQSHPVFTPEASPALDPRIEQLIVELQSPSYEQLNQIWGFVGAKQLPSVLYRVRMVALQDLATESVGPPILEITSAVGMK